LASAVIYYFRDDLRRAWDTLGPEIQTWLADFGSWFSGIDLFPQAEWAMRTWWNGIDHSIKGEGARILSEFKTEIINWFFGINLYNAGVNAIKTFFNGLKSLGGAIRDWITNSISADPIDLNVKKGGSSTGTVPDGPVNPNPAQMHLNFQKNSSLLDPARSSTSALADNRQMHNNVRVNAPVTVQVREAVDAPGAVGNAIGSAVQTAALPSRMQTGPAA